MYGGTTLTSTTFGILACALVLSTPGSAAAQETGSPNTVRQQGYLTGEGGNPVDAPAEMEFILQQETAGGAKEAVWSVTRDVSVSNGSYSVALGSEEAVPSTQWLPMNEWFPGSTWSPGSEWFPGSTWITTSVEGETLTPAQEVTSSPFALWSSGLYNQGNATINTHENASILLNSDASGNAGRFAIFEGQTDDPLFSMVPTDDNSSASFDMMADGDKVRTGVGWRNSDRDALNEPVKQYNVVSENLVNTYSGNVLLGPEGTATVQLPAYFDALNEGEIRYVLTPIGASAPDLHVSSKVSDGEFRIAGGPAEIEVSWLITSERSTQ